ncbi:GNAT family N-acetyltransferase [Streptomyces albiaxialis]|uniref:GNAT family N-acetyltransferase n=1 Tax=Streptomyces albiaxialis TaxID=329523 RepID=A0ABP5HC90_9ACTN
MPRLTVPDVRVHASFVAAMAEFRAEGRGGPDDGSTVGRAIRDHGSVWQDPRIFAGYVEAVRADARDDVPRPDGGVPCTTLWYVDNDTYLGRLAIRHTLTPPLLEWGGHIGYDIRPTARRRGHATAMLRAALPWAREVGIRSALVTCDTDNVASRKVIESCGGLFEDIRSGKLRYWVPTDRPFKER